MEKKKNTVLNIALIIIVIETILLAAASIYIIYNGKVISEKESPKVDPPIKESKENQQTETKEEVLEELIGEWGMCLKEYDCRGIIIAKTKNSEFTYTPYIMWSEGGVAGKIKTFEKISEKVYKISVYYAAYNNEMSSGPEQTIEYTIDINNIKENNIKIDNKVYQKIVGDRESFFKALF